MKKTLIALSIASMAVSSIATAASVYSKDGYNLDIYGRVQGVVYSSNAAELNSYNDTSLQASGRLGFDMRTQLTQGIAGFANMEWDVADGTMGDGGEWGVRYAWIGADFGQYGQVKGGRFEDALKPALAATDIFDDWGAIAQISDSDIRDGMIMYTWSGFGFDVSVSYQTAQDNQVVKGLYLGSYNSSTGSFENLEINGSDRYETVDIDHGYAASVGYTSAPVLFGPIAVSAGYSFIQTQAKEVSFLAKNGVDLDKVHSYAFSASWGDLANGPYVAALYNERNFSAVAGDVEDVKASGFETVAAYAFSNGITLATGFNHLKFDDGTTTVKAQTIPVYANYQINPRFNVWGEARFDAGTDDNVKSAKSFYALTGADFEESVFSLGARYTF